MHQVGFGFWNWIAVIIYLVVMLLIGAYFTKRASQNTDSFFTASGRLPSWAVGFSIYATTLSAITFMSTPEKSIFDGLGVHCGQHCHCCNHTATYLFLCAIF